MIYFFSFFAVFRLFLRARLSWRPVDGTDLVASSFARSAYFGPYSKKIDHFCKRWMKHPPSYPSFSFLVHRKKSAFGPRFGHEFGFLKPWNQDETYGKMGPDIGRMLATNFFRAIISRFIGLAASIFSIIAIFSPS